MVVGLCSCCGYCLCSFEQQKEGNQSNRVLNKSHLDDERGSATVLMSQPIASVSKSQQGNYRAELACSLLSTDQLQKMILLRKTRMPHFSRLKHNNHEMTNLGQKRKTRKQEN